MRAKRRLITDGTRVIRIIAGKHGEVSRLSMFVKRFGSSYSVWRMHPFSLVTNQAKERGFTIPHAFCR